VSLLAITAIAFAALFILWIGFSLLRWGKRSRGAYNVAEKQFSVGEPRVPVCPREVLDRIFQREDLDFVARQDSREALELFRCERKRIAHFWLRQIRQEIAGIRQAHVAMARESSNLNPATELKVALECMLVSGLCWLMTVAIYFLGPVHTRGLAHYASELAADLSSVVGKSTMTPQARAENPTRGGG
jgi:hypothetical protein